MNPDTDECVFISKRSLRTPAIAFACAVLMLFGYLLTTPPLARRLAFLNAAGNHTFLENKTTNEVLKLLGEPDLRINSRLIWKYKDPTFDPNGMSCLDVYFDPKSGRVLKSKFDTSGGELP